MFNIVLYSPQIPPNTGNIGRLCVATGSVLHLIHPFGFRIDERAVKRAGLDYWEHVQMKEHASLDEFIESIDGKRFFLVSKRGRHIWSDIKYSPGDYLVFGSEVEGLPEKFLIENGEKTIRLPHNNETVRSLNLAVSAGIVLYEAIRQNLSSFDERADLQIF